MANKTILDYTAAASIDGTNDYLLIEQTVGPIYKKINRSTFLGVTGQPVDISTTQTLTNKTLTAPTISAAVLSGTFTGTYTLAGTPTFPASVVTLTGTQTLTNKTLTSPAITGGTIDNTTITVDSISGHTTATIVSVGGVQMNNGVVSTSNSVVTATIADSAVTPAKLLAGTGTGWSWTNFTPIWSVGGLVVGNGTVTARYMQTGKTVNVRIAVSFGTTTSVGSSGVSFSLPITAGTYTAGHSLGNAKLVAAGAAYLGAVQLNTTTLADIVTFGSAATYVNQTAILTAVPGTWTNGDVISLNIVYEAA